MATPLALARSAAWGVDGHSGAHYNARQVVSAGENRVIASFADRGTEDIFNRRRTKQARRTGPPSLWRVASRKLDQLNAAVSRGALRLPPGNRLEALQGDRQGQHSIRGNDRYRTCFLWTPDGPARVAIVDYH